MKKYIISAVIALALVTAGILNYANKDKDGNNRTASFQDDAKTTSRAMAELIGKKYNKPAESVIIGMQTDAGTFAKGTVNFKNEGGGAIWIAAKTTNGWELVTDGNGIAACEPVNRYNVPKDMVSQCLDTKNNNKLITR